MPHIIRIFITVLIALIAISAFFLHKAWMKEADYAMESWSIFSDSPAQAEQYRVLIKKEDSKRG